MSNKVTIRVTDEAVDNAINDLVVSKITKALQNNEYINQLVKDLSHTVLASRVNKVLREQFPGNMIDLIIRATVKKQITKSAVEDAIRERVANIVDLEKVNATHIPAVLAEEIAAVKVEQPVDDMSFEAYLDKVDFQSAVYQSPEEQSRWLSIYYQEWKVKYSFKRTQFKH